MSKRRGDDSVQSLVLVWEQAALHHLKTFGCIVYIQNTKAHLQKLEYQVRKMIFVCYERGSKAFR